MVDTYLTVWGKLEAAYGTDAVPTGAANAVLSFDLETKPFDIEQLKRALDKPTRGATGSAASRKRREFGYKVELAGSGTAGIAPAWMEQNQACGMAAPVLVATVSAQQRFAAVGAAISAMTHYHWVENQRRRGVGGRGDISSINFEAGKIPYIKYDWVELLHSGGLDQVAPGASDYARWKDPLEVNADNTSVSLHGFACVLKSCDIKVNAAIDFRDLPGRKYVARGNHEVKADMLIELPDLAAKNYFDAALNNIVGPLLIIHGTQAGRIVEVSGPNTQILDCQDASEGQTAMVRISALLNVVAGQDDLIITAK